MKRLPWTNPGLRRVAIFVLALATLCGIDARAGSGRGGMSTTGGGGHACAGHGAAHQCNHGGGVVSHGCAGSGSHVHGGGDYGVSYSNHISAIDQELHERVVKTQQAKEAFVKTNPCPANGASTGSCPGYVIQCVNPDPAEPARCFEASNLEWRRSSR